MPCTKICGRLTTELCFPRSGAAQSRCSTSLFIMNILTARRHCSALRLPSWLSTLTSLNRRRVQASSEEMLANLLSKCWPICWHNVDKCWPVFGCIEADLCIDWDKQFIELHSWKDAFCDRSLRVLCIFINEMPRRDASLSVCLVHSPRRFGETTGSLFKMSARKRSEKISCRTRKQWKRKRRSSLLQMR